MECLARVLPFPTAPTPTPNLPRRRQVRARGSPRLTRVLAAAICDRVRVGVTLDVAAPSLGIMRPTLDEWRRLGAARPSSVYGELLAHATRAEVQCHVALVSTVYRAAVVDGDVQAAKWLLERHEHHGRDALKPP